MWTLSVCGSTRSWSCVWEATAVTHRLMAFGVAGLSVVADSLAAIRYCKEVTPVRDDRGITNGFIRRGEFPCFGNDDDRVDAIACGMVDNFSRELKRTPAYRGA